MASFIAYLISVVYIKRDITHYIKNQITDLLPAFTIGTLTAMPAYLLSFVITNNYLLISAQFVTVMIIYVLSVKVIQPELYTKTLDVAKEKLSSLRK